MRSSCIVGNGSTAWKTGGLWAVCFAWGLCVGCMGSSGKRAGGGTGAMGGIHVTLVVTAGVTVVGVGVVVGVALGVVGVAIVVVAIVVVVIGIVAIGIVVIGIVVIVVVAIGIVAIGIVAIDIVAIDIVAIVTIHIITMITLHKMHLPPTNKHFLKQFIRIQHNLLRP